MYVISGSPARRLSSKPKGSEKQRLELQIADVVKIHEKLQKCGDAPRGNDEKAYQFWLRRVTSIFRVYRDSRIIIECSKEFDNALILYNVSRPPGIA